MGPCLIYVECVRYLTFDAFDYSYGKNEQTTGIIFSI